MRKLSVVAVNPFTAKFRDRKSAPWLEERKQAAAAVLLAREVADLPTGHYAIQFSPDVIGTLLPHVDAVNQIRRQLWFDILGRVEAQDTEGAVRSCQALLNAGRSLGDETFVISQLVRMVIGPMR